MKKLLVLFVLFCVAARADTINLHWLNYDGTIYQNSSCTVDGDLIVPTTPPTKYGYTFTGWKISPYTPIEYLESTGTQYIDTGYAWQSNNIKYDVELMMINDHSGFTGLFGSQRIGSDTNWGIQFWFSSNSNVVSHYIGSSANVYSWTITEQEKYHFIGETFADYTWEITVNNSKHTGTWRGTIGSEKNLTNIGLFTLSDNSGMTNRRIKNTRVYKFKLTDNDTLVRDFIPVLDENGTPCMFDKVEGKFYYNAGTGQFIAGPTL